VHVATTQVAALQTANKTMRQQFKQIDVNAVEDLYDDLSDLIEESNMIQESLR
jgi:hypothetical protein